MNNRNVVDPMEEIFKQIHNFLKKLFNPEEGRQGGGGGNYTRPPISLRTILYVILVPLIIVGILTSFYTVDVSEEGVVTRFQQYNSTSPSGLHFKLPFFIDRVTKVPSKVLLQQEFGFRSSDQQRVKGESNRGNLAEESLMLTGDLNVADVKWIVQYRISDPWKFLFHARDVQKNIRDVSMSIMRRVVGDRLVGEILTTGRIEIADEAKKLTQEVVDKYDMGITIAAVVLQDVTPPDLVKAAFNDVNAAKQEQEKAINVAERGYNNVIPEAKGKAEQVIAEAEAHAIMLINQAKGDASNFNARLVEYLRAPEITRRRLYLEAMEEIYSNLDKLFIVDSKVKGVLPLYPLRGILVYNSSWMVRL
ncbi:MAG: FtsH protease activity modulator HflK [Oligoflexia bacterium]|nr:FtsH protease activity modulator HflK [Oligoflexia bacterium]